MRLRLGRPNLDRYRDRFDLPEAASPRPGMPPSVTWLGVATLLLDDGYHAVLTDGFFSRPGLLRIAAGRISPNPARVDGCLAHAGITRLAAVIPGHTHIDHALDSALVADRTGAFLVGGDSVANIGRGYGLAEDRIVVATAGQPTIFGGYQITLLASRHCPPDRFPGVIDTPVVPPVRASAYRCGESWSMLVRHSGSGRQLLIQPSAGFVPGILTRYRAETVYLSVGQLGAQSSSYIADYWTHTVRAVGARQVVLIHWDDFFRPLSKSLRALPYAADDLDFSIRCLTELADADGVTIHLPTLWRAENPWPAD